MGLFDGNKGQATSNTGPQQAAQPQQEAMPEGDDFLSSIVGSNDELKGHTNAAYLSLAQDVSAVVRDKLCNVGEWYNSASKQVYGPSVTVIPLDVKLVWIEKDATGSTLKRYLPNSIPVTRTPRPAGERGPDLMSNPATGNKIEELYMYAVMLPDHLDDGVLFMTPSSLSMSGCRAWHTKIMNTRLPDGRSVKMWATKWLLEVAPKEGKKRVNYVIAKATNVGLVDQNMYFEHLRPQISAPRDMLAIAAPVDEVAE